MQKYFRDVLMTLLNRMQTSRTDKFMVGLTHWICYIAAIEVGNYGPDYVPQAVEAIQDGYAKPHESLLALTLGLNSLWTSILNNIIILSLPKMPPKDRRIAAIGLTRMLFYSRITRNAPSW
jgi:exportin-2 (importin alpha re-exporter)